MKHSHTAFFLALSLVLLLAAATVFYRNLSTQVPPVIPVSVPSETPAETEPYEDLRRIAPDITVLDESSAEFRLSDYSGHPVVLAFWATWCPACRREWPVFQDVSAEIGDDVVFLMVNVTSEEDSPASVKAFLDENDYSMPVFYDPEGDAMDTYVAYSLPVTYFISTDGKITHQVLGSLTPSALLDGISLITDPA